MSNHPPSSSAQHPPLSSTPTDPYTWRESVLSTRSLSYLSQADSTLAHSRQASLAHMYRPPTRRNSAMDSESEYGGLEMAQARRLDEIGETEEVPESVSRCLLFTLPREIRDRVYAFCLTARENQAVEWPMGRLALGLAPELLRTCKIIAAEATRALYAENRLAFYHPSDANMFVRAMASPGHTRWIAHLTLHVRAQDTRLWMPYLTSTDLTRSLKADFPNLRDLGIQYRSNKWQAALPVEANLRHWSEDGRLDELINGLGHVFFPTNAAASERSKHRRRGSENSMDRWSDDETPAKPGNASLREPPVIKLLVQCRIPNTHLAALTSDLPLPPPQAPAQPAPAQMGAPPGTIHGVPPPPPPAPGLPAAAAQAGIAALQDLLSTSPPAPEPVKEGEEFRGFTIADFKGTRVGVKRAEPGKVGGHVARTVFARKGRAMLALEVFTM